MGTERETLVDRSLTLVAGMFHEVRSYRSRELGATGEG
jgi:hypothetical protein